MTERVWMGRGEDSECKVEISTGFGGRMSEFEP